MRRALLTGRLLVLAVLLTMLLVLAGNVASTLAVERQLFGTGVLGFIDAPDVFVLHFITTGVPFLYLALRGERRKSMWVIAAAVMASFWAFFVWQLRQDYLADFAGGANIGLGLVMLGSPIIALLILTVASRVLRRQIQ